MANSPLSEGDASQSRPDRLPRELGLVAASLLGLGSIVGTGVFVTVGIAIDLAGPGVLAAIGLAVAVAACNGLNSAQLAASHPVSGGTYEYGYRYLQPWLGFTAGWLFLCAKTASAAAAALTIAAYLGRALPAGNAMTIPLAMGAVLLLTAVALRGVRVSSSVNGALVCMTVGALCLFCVSGWPDAALHPREWAFRFQRVTAADTLHATALMFVAYTGYGRIATLGEEVRDPARTIPRAIVATLVVSAVLYAGVAVVLLGLPAMPRIAGAVVSDGAPLASAAGRFGPSWLPAAVTIGALTAMVSVLLNLLLGLSRVVVAMGRRGDLPARWGELDHTGTTPRTAVLVSGGAVALVALLGDVPKAWSLSAFFVLLYYAITNLAALALPPAQRQFPKSLGWAGLAACLFLASRVEPFAWWTGMSVIAVGLAWHVARRQYHGSGGK